MTGRLCPLCRARQTTQWQFCCARCYRKMPLEKREQAKAAWRNRVMDPMHYTETLAALIQFVRFDRQAQEMEQE